MCTCISGTAEVNLAEAMGCILEITTPEAPFGTEMQDFSAESLPIQRHNPGHEVLGDVTGC